MSDKAVAQLDYTVIVECPNCDKIIDLIDGYDDDGVITRPIFNNKWDDIKGVDIECEGCGNFFELDGVEY